MSREPAMSPSAIPWAGLLTDLPPARRADAQELAALMQEATGDEPTVWARRIVGFGRYRYRYESGHEGTAPLVGFAPTARHLTVYLLGDFRERYPAVVERLGSARLGRGCVYLGSLDRIDRDALATLIRRTVRVHRGQSIGD